MHRTIKRIVARTNGCSAIDDMTPDIRESSNEKFNDWQNVFVKPVDARCTHRWNNAVMTAVGPGVQTEVNENPGTSQTSERFQSKNSITVNQKAMAKK